VHVQGTRERIVSAAAAAFMRQGYAGSGLKQITSESVAPSGSLYHFFPGGKVELAAETLRWAGAGYQQLVEAVLDAAPDIVTGVRDAFAGAAATLEATGYADACPIATVALEVASTNDDLRRVTNEIFESWLRSATDRLVASGLAPTRARELAIVFVAAIEGGFLLSRAARSTEPMRVLGDSVADQVRAELTARRRRR
jgi:AcrR family transcriptional regulator